MNAVLGAVITCVLLSAKETQTAEIHPDSYGITLRTSQPPGLDNFVQDFLHQIPSNLPCETHLLHDALFTAMAGPLRSRERMRIWTTGTPLEHQLKQNSISSPNRIYSSTFLFKCDSKDLVIGTDKFEHFFIQGRDMFDLQRAGNDPFQWSWFTEMDCFGAAATRIITYADLAANFAGMRFWERLTSTHNGYFQCQDNVWHRTTSPFTWRDFIDPSWDERYNPSLRLFQPSNRTMLNCSLLRDVVDDDEARRWVLNPLCDVSAETPRTCLTFRSRFAQDRSVQCLIKPEKYALMFSLLSDDCPSVTNVYGVQGLLPQALEESMPDNTPPFREFHKTIPLIPIYVRAWIQSIH